VSGEQDGGPVWLTKERMREVARICNPDITDEQFNRMWAERILEKRAEDVAKHACPVRFCHECGAHLLHRRAT
jgi:hypothetical protein